MQLAPDLNRTAETASFILPVVRPGDAGHIGILTSHGEEEKGQEIAQERRSQCKLGCSHDAQLELLHDHTPREHSQGYSWDVDNSWKNRRHQENLDQRTSVRFETKAKPYKWALLKHGSSCGWKVQAYLFSLPSFETLMPFPEMHNSLQCLHTLCADIIFGFHSLSYAVMVRVILWFTRAIQTSRFDIRTKD